VGDISVEGQLTRVVGEVRILRERKGFFEAEITAMYDEVKRGDKLIPIQPAVKWTSQANAPEGFRAKIVDGETEGYDLYNQGQLVLIDKGSEEGMREGYMLRAFRDEDPVTEKRGGVPPDFKGDIQVIHAARLSSVGYILRNTEPLERGDLLYPAQDFPNRPPSPIHKHKTVEITD
jgi:hypothetical protein